MQLIITIIVDLPEKNDPTETVMDQFLLGQELNDVLERAGYGDATLSVEVFS